MPKPEKLSKEQREKCRIVTPVFMVSYPHVLVPHKPQGADKAKFSISMHFPKDREIIGTTRAGKEVSLAAIVKRAKKFGWGEDESKWPKFRSWKKDGDDEKYEGKPGHAGHWIVRATCNADQPPMVVDENMERITEAANFYPGCKARAYIFAYPWEFMGKHGIGFILDHVQKVGKGKPLSGKAPVEDVFAPVISDDEDEKSSSEDDADSDEE